jgi:hypothetical protein
MKGFIFLIIILFIIISVSGIIPHHIRPLSFIIDPTTDFTGKVYKNVKGTDDKLYTSEILDQPI